MDNYNNNAKEKKFKDALIDEKDFLKNIIQGFCQNLLEEEIQDHLGAKKYERPSSRQGHRNGCMRYCQMLWIRNLTHPPKHHYGAASWASSPSTNFLFSSTRSINWWPFNFFQVLAALIVSLKTIESVAFLDPHPFVLWVLSLDLCKGWLKPDLWSLRKSSCVAGKS